MSSCLSIIFNLNIIMQGAKRFFRAAFRFAPLTVLPFALSPSAFFWGNSGPKLQRDNIKDRIHISVLQSNYPCEDRKDVLQLTAIEGFAAAVYDGHGGWQVSDLCSKTLLKSLDEILKKNKEGKKYSNDDQLITESIKEAFLEVEKMYIQSARVAYQLGFGRAARAGSCALVSVVHGGKLYCGNAGDSLGIVVEEASPMGYIPINRFLNADNPEEQQRLKGAFPEEEDIFVCKRPNNTSCYVKGRLQPTRSIGDLRLKLAEFNNPRNLSNQFQFQSPLKKFTGNYITAEPQIKVIPLKKSQKWAILASDGLWDQLGLQEVAQTCKSTPIQNLGQSLIQKCLQKASLDSKLTVEEIKAKPRGKKRDIHDDITIVVMDLRGQTTP